jgi:hypothetical protein
MGFVLLFIKLSFDLCSASSEGELGSGLENSFVNFDA